MQVCEWRSLNETRPLPKPITTWASTQPAAEETALSVRSPHASGNPTEHPGNIHYRIGLASLMIQLDRGMVKQIPRWVRSQSPNRPGEGPRAIARD